MQLEIKAKKYKKLKKNLGKDKCFQFASESVSRNELDEVVTADTYF